MALKINWVKTDGGRSEAFPESVKKQKHLGDCVIRATAIATETPYKDVWENLFGQALSMGMFPNNDHVCKEHLLSIEWKELKFGKKMVRMDDKIIRDMSKDKWIICYTRRHWVAMKDSTVYDTWQSQLNSIDDYSRVFRVYYKD
jgi:hypothetical protein